MFLNHLYGGMDEPDAKIIDVFVCKLRKKLANASGGRDHIETIWGRGYTRESQPSKRSQADAARSIGSRLRCRAATPIATEPKNRFTVR